MNRDLSCQLESLAEKFTQQLRAGIAPPIEQVAREHPEMAERIRELFPVLKMMESRAAQPAAADDSLMQEELNTLQGLPPQRKLGEFRIIREIGRGGMGIVFQAEQESLGRHVALKLLPDSAQFDERRRQRFQHEARASGMLHHTNIVPVFGIGHHNDVSYFVMQYIEGQSLDKVIAELRTLQDLSQHPARDRSLNETGTSLDTIVSGVALNLLDEGAPAGDEMDGPAASQPRKPPRPVSGSGSGSTSRLALSANSHSLSRGTRYFRNIAKIGLQVSDALAYAHSKNILHRDIKPANLLVEENGNIWVTDFGLAKLMNEANLTRTGETVGTLRYLPPEQFDGKSDQRSDVYSLGLTLYELLTLQPAFEGEDFAQLVQNVTDSTPVSLRKLEPRIPRDLATIVTKAIAKAPAERYQSVAAMHEDLELFLAGKPIHAQRASEFDRLVKAVRRWPVVSALAALLLTTLITGSALVTWKWREAAAALTLAENEASSREKINDFLLNDFLSFANPQNESDPDIRLRTVLERSSLVIDSRFGQLPLVAAELHTQFGKIWLSLSQPARSKQHFERAFQLCSDHLGPDDPETNNAWYRTGLAEARLGNYGLALLIFDEAIRFNEVHFGRDAVETFQVRFNRAELLKDMARYDEARQELQAYLAVADREDLLDADAARQRLADVLFAQGEFDQAKIILEKLQSELDQRVEFDEHEIRTSDNRMHDFYLLLGTREALALIALEQGFPDQAAEIQQENLAMSTRLLGAEHATTLSHAHNLAGAWMKTGRPDQARQLLEENIPLSEQVRGIVHSETLSMKNALGMALVLAGEHRAAEKLLVETRQSALDVLGVRHPDTLTCSHNLSSIWYRTGQAGKAEQLLSETVPLLREVLGDHHTQTINALADLGHIHRHLKKYDLAEAELAESIELSRGRMRVFHPELLQNLSNLQMLLVETGQYGKAEPLGAELIEGYTLELGPEDWQTVSAKNIQAFVFKQQQKLDRAHPLYLEVWQHHHNTSGPADAKTVPLLLILAEVEHELGLHRSSAARLKEFLDSPPREHPDSWSRCRAEYLLGRALMESGELTTAETVLLAAFDAMETCDEDLDDSARNSALRKTAGCLTELYSRSGDAASQETWRSKGRDLKTGE